MMLSGISVVLSMGVFLTMLSVAFTYDKLGIKFAAFLSGVWIAVYLFVASSIYVIMVISPIG